MYVLFLFFFFVSSRRRHTRSYGDWSSDVCSSDLVARPQDPRWETHRKSGRAPQVTGHGDDVSFADVVAGEVRGRSSREEITYSERGNVQGVQFFAVAAVAYEAARREGLGRELPTDWFLQDVRD